MMEWRLWPYPPRRPHPAGVRASGQRAAPPSNRLATGPGNCSPPLGGAIPRPVSRAGTVVEAPHPAESPEGAGPENSLRHPSAGCSSTLVSRVGAAEDMRAAENSDAVGPGNGSPPLGGGLFLPARPGCRIPHLPSSGSHAPDQVPTASLISIGRQRVPIHRGAMMPRSCSSI